MGILDLITYAFVVTLIFTIIYFVSLFIKAYILKRDKTWKERCKPFCDWIENEINLDKGITKKQIDDTLNRINWLKERM